MAAATRLVRTCMPETRMQRMFRHKWGTPGQGCCLSTTAHWLTQKMRLLIGRSCQTSLRNEMTQVRQELRSTPAAALAPSFTFLESIDNIVADNGAEQLGENVVTHRLAIGILTAYLRGTIPRPSRLCILRVKLERRLLQK